MNDIYKDSDGNIIFTGQEDPNNTSAMPKKGSQIECPICHEMVDFLLGQDTSDGGKMGCTKDYVRRDIPREGVVDNGKVQFD